MDRFDEIAKELSLKMEIVPIVAHKIEDSPYWEKDLRYPLDHEKYWKYVPKWKRYWNWIFHKRPLRGPITLNPNVKWFVEYGEPVIEMDESVLEELRAISPNDEWNVYKGK